MRSFKIIKPNELKKEAGYSFGFMSILTDFIVIYLIMIDALK